MSEVKTAKAKRVVIQYPEGTDIDPRTTATVTIEEKGFSDASDTPTRSDRLKDCIS